jgi:hypothetical protein
MSQIGPNNLREMLNEPRATMWRILTRKEMNSVMPDAVGVASPFIVHDPNTYEKYMLFTAWSDPNGMAREVWIANIDERMKLWNFKKIADGRLFNVTGLNAATAFWDDYNEEWVFACTAYGAPNPNYGYFIFFDENWNVKGTQVIEFPDTSSVSISLGDAGLGLAPLDNNTLIITGGDAWRRSMWIISNYRQRPLPSPTLQNVTSSGNWFHLLSRYSAPSRDVHQTFIYNGQLLMISEKVSYSNLWNLEVAFGPEKDWSYIDNVYMFGKYMMPVPITWDHAKINYTPFVANIGHPHYTTLLGRPLLLHAAFPYWNSGGKRAWAHEIWAQEIDPEVAFSPKHQFPLAAVGTNEPYTVGNLPIPTFGAKTAVIELYGVSAAGTLTVIESSSPSHIWTNDGYTYSSSYSILSGSNKIIINSPAPYIALNTNVNLNEWDVYLE